LERILVTEALQARRSFNNPGDYIDRPQIALQILYSDRSPLYDVRNHARRIPKDTSCETMFRGLSNSSCPMALAVNTLDEERSYWSAPIPGRQTVVAIHQKFLVEADGIEPTTSCLQSTRSPS
jgi:hypothetical protein